MKGGMRFRSFSDFNKALLSKQCWRLIKDENSLMGKIFKGRYIPKGKFLDASTLVISLTIYAWRSILSARDIVKKGAYWVICNVRGVIIWKDKWVPSQFNFAICSLVRVLH
ncbi:hypothetical protein QL285_080574 [Trifolium repens]|nr:hypothetical protein QL285_080574 [Trifolium repens]